jgi:hypothetical protein
MQVSSDIPKLNGSTSFFDSPTSIESAEKYARGVPPALPVVPFSCTTEEGIGKWTEWLSDPRQLWAGKKSAS